MLKQTIKLLQNSYKTFCWSALIAFLLAILTFFMWQDIFDFKVTSVILCTFISWLWMLFLFMSVVNIWQGRKSLITGIISYIFLLSTALSGFWMLVFYPAVMSWDGLLAWQQALNNQYETWHPPILAMTMKLTQYLVKEPSLFSFIQGSLFWGSIFCLIRLVISNNKLFLLNSSMIILLPPLWLYSNATTSNTWLTIFMLLIMLFFLKSIYKQEIKFFIISIVFLSLAIMFRREAILLLLIFLPSYLFIFPSNKSTINSLIKAVIIVFLAVLPSQIVEMHPHIVSHDNPSAPGLFNQYIGTIVNSQNNMTDREIELERDSIDRKFGQGTFAKLNQKYTCYTGNYITLGSSAVIGEISRTNNKFIISKIIKAGIRHPLGLIKHKH